MTIHQSIRLPDRIKLTVDDFLLLDNAGHFDGMRKVELLEGVIFHVGREKKLDTAIYETLLKGGTFDDWRKTELIDGVIFGMNAQRMPHAFVKSRLALELGILLREMKSSLEVVTEGTVDMRPFNLPEPDIAITSADFGEGYMPLPSVRLIVEVCDTSHSRDLKQKLKVYADVGIPEYWVVDLPKRRIHQFWKPQGLAYGKNCVVEFGDRIASATIAGLVIETVGLTS
jgi:Uma2 family endonuclease